jgi:hypothetical protein
MERIVSGIEFVVLVGQPPMGNDDENMTKTSIYGNDLKQRAALNSVTQATLLVGGSEKGRRRCSSYN